MGQKWGRNEAGMERELGGKTHLLLSSLTRIAGISSPLSLIGIDPWASHLQLCGDGDWDCGGR